MNFNRNNDTDYGLKKSLTNELIQLYGVEVDFLYSEKVNLDIVLRDFTHLTQKAVS